MITATFINIIFGLVYLLTRPISLLPVVTLSGDFTTAITNASNMIYSLNNFIPIDTIIVLLRIALSIEFFYFAYLVIMWIIKRFPTQS